MPEKKSHSPTFEKGQGYFFTTVSIDLTCKEK